MQKTTTLTMLRKFFGKALPLLVLLIGVSLSSINAQVYNNGNLGTGATSKSGVAAPAGTQWHEMQNNTGNTTQTNVSIAYDCSPILGSSRVADNFTVPATDIWNINKMTFYAVVLPPAPASSPITAVRVVIRDASPVGASNVVYGDLTTNRLGATSFSNIYTIANSQVPAPGTPPNQNFVVWKVEADVNVSLRPGNYWVEWQIVGGAGQRVFALMSQPIGARTAAGYNGVNTFNGGAWASTFDNSNTGASPVNVDYCFGVNYTVSPCTSPTASVLSQVGYPTPPVSLINETFNTVLPAGWAQQNLSTPAGTNPVWFLGNTAVFPGNTPPGYAACNFNSVGGANTISNWMFAPNITMKNGDSLTFFTRTTVPVFGTFPDRLQIRRSQNGASTNVGATNTSVGDFTDLLLDINPTYSTTGYPTAWTKFTVVMAGLPPAGVSGRIAFRYFVENGGPAGANSDYIGVDDVVYKTPGATNPPNTCLGSTANLKVDITGGIAPYTVTINTVPPTTPIVVNNYQSGANIPITPSATTQYTLTSVVGCGVGTGNSGTPTVVVSATPFPPLTIDALPDAPICAGDPTLLTVKAPGPALPQTISSTGAITIPDSGPATPYPATLNVAGFPGAGATVTGVTLVGLNHTWASDLDIALQQPNTGTTVMLLSDVGGSADFVNNTMNFADANPLFVAPPAANAVGNVRPTNPGGGDNFPGAGPQNVAANGLLSQFAGNFNGAWRLWINDQVGGDQGSVSGGYRIDFSVPTSAPLPAGYTFLWTPAAGLSNPTANPVGASPMNTTTYTVLVTAPSGCQGTASKTVIVNQLPAIVTNPSNFTLCNGQIATFTVVATGAGPLTYQWQEQVGGAGPWNNLNNSIPYSGVTTATLTINPATGLLSGNKYRCIVSGICNPAATSNGATLIVNPLPVVPITPAGPVCGGVKDVFGTQLTAGSAVPPVPGSQTFTSGTINVSIPEGNFPTRPTTAATSIIPVSGIPANATITNVTARLNATHPYANDIVAVLKSPTGAVINLDAIGGYANAAGANYVNTGFTLNQSAPSITTGAAPFTGTWKADLANVTFTAFGSTLSGGPVGFDPTTTSPATYMGALGSGAANGNWTLAAYDAGAPDVGNFTKWDLVIDYTTPGTGTGATLTYVWSPITGLYTDASASVPYTGGNSATVYAAPTAFTIYTVTATNTTTGCVGTNNVAVNYTPPAPNVVPNPVSICLNTAVRLTSSSASTLVATSTSASSLGLAVPDNTANGVSTNLAIANIPANAVISDVSVKMNMPSQYPGDLIINLKAPNGKIVNVYKYNNGTFTGGAGGLNAGWFDAISTYNSTTLHSAVPSPWRYGQTAPTGPYKMDRINGNVPGTVINNPAGFASDVVALGDLGSGTALNGTWTLALADGGPGDVSTLQNWELKVTYVVGVPATPAVWSPSANLYLDSLGTVAYPGDARDTVWAKPTPFGVYNFDVTVKSLPVPSPTNPAPITIPDAGNGNPYPSVINVLGYPTTGVTVDTIIINGISHTWGDDVDVLVQSPTGQNVILMSDIGGADDMVNQTYKFNDNGPAMSATVLNPSGVYKPTNNGATDNFPAPGPGTVTQATPTLGSFGNASNVNGQWKLFLVDDVAGDQGSVSGGWTIKFNYQFPACTSPAKRVVVTVRDTVKIVTNPVNTSACITTGTNTRATFTVVATGNALTYQWQTAVLSSTGIDSFINVNNDANYSGATTATLTINNPPASWSGKKYRVVVNGSCGSKIAPNPLLFSPAVLTVPSVTLTNSGLSKLFPGLKTTLVANASPAPATYEWYLNGTLLTTTAHPTNQYVVDVDHLGDYTVKTISATGCVNVSNLVNVSDSASGKVFIYPNPNSGIFQVRYYASLNTRAPRGLNIFDDKGSRISINQYNNAAPYQRMDVDLRKYGKGIYWVEVVDVNGERLAVGRAVVL